MPVLPNAVEVKLKGFQPGENLSLVFYTEKDGITSRVEEFPVDPVNAQGEFLFREELLRQFSSGTSSVTWKVQVIHTRGVACADVTLQGATAMP